MHRPEELEVNIVTDKEDNAELHEASVEAESVDAHNDYSSLRRQCSCGNK